mmetsp:Transcript_1193/g.1428  ORF Transcript_1193/g.1428 Transcript_1193/m.1428 type:complete len:289 (+) Transcript_1193:35-901(+)
MKYLKNIKSKMGVATAKMPKNEKKISKCPICLEEKNDIICIPHWEAHGDISEHKMCGDCTRLYTKNECPFCREVIVKDELLALIRDLVSDIKTRSNQDSHPDHLASFLERWELLEMEYESNPRVLCRIAKIVVQDDELKTHLRHGIEMKSGWLRDAAGIFFRLHSMSAAGSLNISDDEKSLLKEAYETIITKIVPNMEVSGHHYGALYSQAAVPCISAMRSGVGKAEMNEIVKSVGNLIIKLYEKHRRFHLDLGIAIPERMIESYVKVLTEEVWGGEINDPIFLAFYN